MTRIVTSLFSTVVRALADGVAAQPGVPPENREALRDTARSVIASELQRMFGGEQLRMYVPRLSAEQRAERDARIAGTNELADDVARRGVVEWVPIARDAGDPLPERVAYPDERRLPVGGHLLPDESAVGVPRRGVGIEAPAPVRRRRQQHPELGPVDQRAGGVDRRGVDADHQVHNTGGVGGVLEALEHRRQVHQVWWRLDGDVLGPVANLKGVPRDPVAEHGVVEQHVAKLRPRDRPIAVILMGGAAGPADADAQPVTGL